MVIKEDIVSKIVLNEFVIEFYKRELKLFSGDIKYCCSIVVLNKLGTILAVIEGTEMNMLSLLDNIYFYIESKEDILYSFPITARNRIYTLGINKYINYIPNTAIIDSKDLLTIYSSILNEDIVMNPICKIDITNHIEEICNILYYNYIVEDLDIDKTYDPNLYFVKN